MSNIFLPFGRMRRLNYIFLTLILAFLWLLIGVALEEAYESDNPNTKFAVLPFVIMLGWPHLMIGLQRAQDIGSVKYCRGWIAYMAVTGAAFLGAISVDHGPGPLSSPEPGMLGPGAMLFMGLIMVLAFALTAAIVWLNLVLIFARGDAGENVYGDDPRGIMATD